LLDPKTSGVSTLALVSKVREDLVLSYAELTDKRRTLSEDSPPIVALKSKINGLNAQLSQLNGENTQTSDSKGSTISSVMTEFDKLQEEEVFAEKSYQSELSALQQARLEASRQQVYLSRIVPPGLPEEPDFPRPMSETLIVFTVGLALWIVAMVGLSAVREHL
jgi:capsular polysaccharide transport system permease protein